MRRLIVSVSVLCLLAAVAVGCRSKPTAPYPIPAMVDPVTEVTPNVK